MRLAYILTLQLSDFDTVPVWREQFASVDFAQTVVSYEGRIFSKTEAAQLNQLVSVLVQCVRFLSLAFCFLERATCCFLFVGCGGVGALRRTAWCSMASARMQVRKGKMLEQRQGCTHSKQVWARTRRQILGMCDTRCGSVPEGRLEAWVFLGHT